MKNHTLMHHTLGTGDFELVHESPLRSMAPLTIHSACTMKWSNTSACEYIGALDLWPPLNLFHSDTAVLTDPATAASDVDRCLNTMLYESRPVYIGVPVDMSHQIISSIGLKTPLVRRLPPNDMNEESNVIQEITSRLRVSRYPIIILDGNCVRNGCAGLANELAKSTGYPYFTTCMGKGGADETLPNFAGVYQGGGSLSAVRMAIEERADCLLWLGSFRVSISFPQTQGTIQVSDETSRPISTLASLPTTFLNP